MICLCKDILSDNSEVEVHALDSRPCVTVYIELSIALCVFQMYLYLGFTYVPIFKEGLRIYL